jgi:hypothetical protein
MILYLQNIVDDIFFENLPIKWQGFDFGRFSKDKSLFDFPKQGFQNAFKGLWLYFKANTPSANTDTLLQEGNNSPSPKGWQEFPSKRGVDAEGGRGVSDGVVYQGGGFFKYYELEQYEEALANCKYEDGNLFNAPGKSPYQEYVFLKDEKMLKALEIDYENEKVKVDLNKLYPNTLSANADTPLQEGNIDIAETLSNLTGKWIKKITPCQALSDTPLQEGNYEVEFEDGTKVNTKDLDYKLIKPLIWWE